MEQPTRSKREIPEDVKQKIEEAQSKRFNANIEKNQHIQDLATNNTIVRAILDHHSEYPFRVINLTCKESVEARNFYLEILQCIGFGTLLGEIIRELLKLGEAFLVFEGNWQPPKFVSPDMATITYIDNGYGSSEEHIEYKVEDDFRNMVLNTPITERPNLLKLMDAYSIRQIELGRGIDLTRSPYVKVIHPRRMTATSPNAPRGVSYFDPVIERLVEAEKTKTEIIQKQTKNYQLAIKKIRDTDKLVFDYAFPQDLSFLQSEFIYLQGIIRHMLMEEVFKQAAMARNFVNENGLILPKLEFETMDLANDTALHQNIREMKQNLGLDGSSLSLEEYIKKLK